MKKTTAEVRHPSNEKLVFRTAAKRLPCETGVHRVWEAASGGPYRVSEFRRPDGSLAYYAQIGTYVIRCDGRTVCVWDVISKHRAKRPALDSCRKHAARQKTQTRGGKTDGRSGNRLTPGACGTT